MSGSDAAAMDRLRELWELREELRAREQVEAFRAHQLKVPDWLTEKLRQPSYDLLLERLARVTAIPGGEDRVSFAAASPPAQRSSESIAILCSKADLYPVPGGFRLDTGHFLCTGANQMFAQEEAVMVRAGGTTPATAVLVGPAGRHALTVRHAVLSNGNLVPDLRCVFGFRDSQPGGVTVRSDAVVAVTSIVARGTAQEDDWALLALDGAPGAPGLDLRRQGFSATGAPVMAIGHPHGLPVKLGTGHVKDLSPRNPRVELDIGKGSSGSPVFSLGSGGVPGAVEGLIQGADAPDIMSATVKCSGCPGFPCALWVAASSVDDPTSWAHVVPASRICADPKVLAVLDA